MNDRISAKSLFLAVLVCAAAAQSALVVAPQPSFAQGFRPGVVSPYPNPATAARYNAVYGGAYGSTNGNPYGQGTYAYGTASGPVYPFGNPYINPINRGNGFFGFNGGGVNANLWRAPSGYYYPWYANAGGFNSVVYVDQSSGQNQTITKDPPLSSMFTDMGAYLDDSKKNNKLSENDYQSLKRRLTDIHSKERSLRIAGGGQIAEGDEGEVRQDLNNFSREMVERIKL